MYTLAWSMSEIIGTVGGVVGILGTAVTTWLALRSNALAREVLEHQKKQGEPEMLVEPFLDFEFGKNGDPSDITTAVFGAEIKNIGSVEVRIADIMVECGAAHRVQCDVELSGDIERQGPPMVVGYWPPTLPCTLLSGRTCTVRFVDKIADNDGMLKAVVPDYRNRKGDWISAHWVRVDASNRTFRSQGNPMFDKIRTLLHDEMMADQRAFQAKAAADVERHRIEAEQARQSTKS